MEGEAFDPTPTLEQEGKETEDANKYQSASNEELVDADANSELPPSSSSSSEITQTWRDKLPEVVRQSADSVQSKLQPIMNHPYVTQGAETVRQGLGQTSEFLGQSAATAQSRLQPLVKHPYVQKSTETVSSTLQPLMNKSAETMQKGSETAKKIYNREEGYEPAKVMPYFAGSLGIVILCILLAGWGSGDRRSKYNVDISGIVAEKVQLPDGRYIAYVEKGVSKEAAQHNILVTHGFLSSRLAGIPGISNRLLEKYAVRVISYDRPGIGQSDPHPNRNYNTSAQDMADIADALGMGDKFWVLGYSGGGPYAWAALHYIPNRLAGVAMFAPMGNPYAKNMTKEETKSIWKEALRGRKMLYRLARHFPSFLPGYLKRSAVTKIVKLLRSVKKGVNPKDRALLETDKFGAAWETSMRESVRSGDPKPHAEDVILHTHDWGFKLTDLRPKRAKRSLFKRIFFFLGGSELPVFSGPIHIFHGTEDKLVPLAMSEYAKRLLPQVELHKLEGEGHFSYFCHCDSCHRDIFKTLFGEVAGLDELDAASVEPKPEAAAPGAPAPVETEAEAEVETEAKETEPTLLSEADKITAAEAEEGIAGKGERVTPEEDEL